MKESDKLEILRPTAAAIFDLAKQLGLIKEIYNELFECSKLFHDDDIKKYFFDKLISKKNKLELIEKKLKPLLSKETYAFVAILAEHDSICVLPEIAALYKDMMENIYSMRVSKTPYTALCVDLGNNSDDENITATKYINKDGLIGTYSIFIEIVINIFH